MFFRKLEKQDLPEINSIYNQVIAQGNCTAHLEARTMEQTKEWFDFHAGSSYPVNVLDAQPGILGWYSLGPYREGREALEHVCELSYYLQGDSRGKGLGSRLMEHALSTAVSLNFTVILAILLEQNEASIGLLKKFSFEQWASLPGIAQVGGKAYNHLYFGRKL